MWRLQAVRVLNGGGTDCVATIIKHQCLLLLVIAVCCRVCKIVRTVASKYVQSVVAALHLHRHAIVSTELSRGLTEDSKHRGLQRKINSPQFDRAGLIKKGKSGTCLIMNKMCK
jgi:hypothetical protein